MSNVIYKEVSGYTKEVAFEGLKFNAGFRNASTAWTNAGMPAIGSNAFKAFCEEYLKKITKSAAGLGAYIQITSAVKDTRKRPYKVIHIPTDGARKFKRVYQIVEAEFEVKETKDGAIKSKITSIGGVVGSAETSSKAERLMRDLISQNKKNYIVRVVHEDTSGQSVTSYGIYTPSVNAVEGNYMAFGIEA